MNYILFIILLHKKSHPIFHCPLVCSLRKIIKIGRILVIFELRNSITVFEHSSNLVLGIVTIKCILTLPPSPSTFPSLSWTTTNCCWEDVAANTDFGPSSANSWICWLHWRLRKEVQEAAAASAHSPWHRRHSRWRGQWT